MPVQTTKKRPVLSPVLTGRSPVKTCDWSPVKTCGMGSSCSTRPLQKASEVRFVDQPKDVGSPHWAPKSFFQDPLLIAKSLTSGPDVLSSDVSCAVRNTLVLGPVCNPQVHVKHPHMNSKPHTQPAIQRCCQNSKFSIQECPERSSQVPIQICQNTPKESKNWPLLNLPVKCSVIRSRGSLKYNTNYRYFDYICMVSLEYEFSQNYKGVNIWQKPYHIR